MSSDSCSPGSGDDGDDGDGSDDSADGDCGARKLHGWYRTQLYQSLLGLIVLAGILLLFLPTVMVAILISVPVALVLCGLGLLVLERPREITQSK
ncbi:hypothetical protein G6M89_11875 [Natronolimnobius sp. AArcel1]|uniref:hypothetical protein n=1 Tax=Natronolimnobius sp. AArcel1 TaxID=1679093 RepID=UPI0013ECA55E|nr:hypothetical protein [Natronolimnobius sp. AArcel1]NGM69697.1 hypothetical protein [Natronolimnobius sp. AArcel1]